MTDFQKFLFDLRGWIVIPSVLTPAQIDACKAHLAAISAQPSPLPEHLRNTYSGPLEELLDHPALVDVLREIVADDLVDPKWTAVENRDAAADRKKPPLAYAFRCDSSFAMVRKAGQPVMLTPHNGGPGMGPSHNYQFVNGRIFSPSTRVVWELNAVKRGGGGTPFLSGTHKSNYNVPPEVLTDEISKTAGGGWDDYECPAGSLVIFTENCCHGSRAWTDETQPRVAVFNHYMHYCMRFHRTPPPAETIAAMSPLRQTLFRDAWMFEWGEGGPKSNVYYDASNRARAKGE